MAYFDQYIAAGTQQTKLIFLDGENMVTGSTRTKPTVGTLSSGYNVIGIQELSAGIPEPEIVPVPGDDFTLGAFTFASDAPRNFILNVGQFDLALNAKLQGTNVIQVAGASMGVADSPEVTPVTVCLVVQGRAIKRNPGQAGQAAWMGWIYPVVTVTPLDRTQFQGRTAAVNHYSCTAQLATNYPYGITFATNLGGVTQDFTQVFSSEYPMMLDAFTSDGSTVNYTLSKTPVSTTYTAAFIERVAMGLASVTPATKVAVLSGAGTTGQRGAFFYGYSGN